MNMPKYTIITPQYNSFELMDNYFESLKKQKFKDFEVIIIDDCSTDNSYAKLNKYVNENPNLNIKLFQSKTNQGPGNARNIGLDAASGEWITFIDNDDWVSSDFLEKIDKVITNNSVNAVIYDYYGYLDGKISINHSMYIPSSGYKSASDCVISVRNHTFGKFYKFSECRELRFPNIRRCEDVAYVSQALALCGNAYYLMEPLYYYRQRPTSLSNQSKMDETGMLQAFDILDKNLGKLYNKELQEKSVCDLLYGVILMMCKANKSNSEILDYIKHYENGNPNWSKANIIKYLGMPKRIFLKCVKIRFISGVRFITKVHSYLISKGS